MPALMQQGDHAAELVDDCLGAAGTRFGGRVGGFGSEEGKRRVPPVVREASFGEEGLVALGVDRQQLNGGDAQVLQVGHGGGVGEASVGPAQGLRYSRHVLREALDVDLVDYRVFPGRTGLRDDRERGFDHDRARHVRRGVEGRAAHRVLRRVQLIVHVVRVHRRLQVHDAVHASTVGVQQELAGVEELSAVRVPRTVRTEAIARARAVSGDVAVPDARFRTQEGEARLSPSLVKDAHIHGGSTARDHRDVEAVARRVNAQARGQRVRFSDAPCGSVGRAGSLGHTIVPLPGERLIKPLRRGYSLLLSYGTTHMPVGLMGRKAYDEAHARLRSTYSG